MDICKHYDQAESDHPFFDWLGVDFGVNTEYQLTDAEKNRYSVFMNLVIPNKEGKLTPYNVDVGIVGMFDFESVRDETKEHIEDLVVVNGLSILYGTIRELVTGITSRMPYGELCIPGASFMDHRPSTKTKAPEAKPSAARKRAPKKTVEKVSAK